MLFEISKESRTRAKLPHEIFMLNLAAFHLLLTPIVFLTIGSITALLIPLSLSCMVLAFIYIRGKSVERTGPWYEMLNYKMAWRRGTFLLIAYAVSGVIITGGWMLGMASNKPGMQEILLTISTRIGIMPTFITVIVTFVLQANAVNMAKAGEVPDSFLKKYPVPEDVQVKKAETAE